jgi:hypothetical protein
MELPLGLNVTKIPTHKITMDHNKPVILTNEAVATKDQETLVVTTTMALGVSIQTNISLHSQAHSSKNNQHHQLKLWCIKTQIKTPKQSEQTGRSVLPWGVKDQ